MYAFRNNIKNLNDRIREFRNAIPLANDDNFDDAYPAGLKKNRRPTTTNNAQNNESTVMMRMMQERRNANRKTRNRDAFRRIMITKFVDEHFGENAEMIGSGSYGTAFRVSFASAVDFKKRVIMASKDVVEGNARNVPPRSKVLMLKVQFLDTPRAVQNARHEDAVHAAIVDKQPDIAPYFVAGSTVVYKTKPTATVRLRASLMQYIPGGQSLKDVPITPLLYARIERAFATLWAMGYSHNDAHDGNILVDPKDGRPYIIDFGFAHEIRDAKRRASFMNKMATEPYPNAAFDAAYKNYLETYFLGIRGNFRFTPDSGLLKRLRRGIPEGDIIAARKAIALHRKSPFGNVLRPES